MNKIYIPFTFEGIDGNIEYSEHGDHYILWHGCFTIDCVKTTAMNLHLYTIINEYEKGNIDAV